MVHARWLIVWIAAEIRATEPAVLGEHPQQALRGVLEAHEVEPRPEPRGHGQRLQELVTLPEDAQRVPVAGRAHVVVGPLDVALAQDVGRVGGFAEGFVGIVGTRARHF